MKTHTLALLLGVFIGAISCQKKHSPEEIFDQAKLKVLGAEQVNLTMKMYWEDPNLKEIDTTVNELKFQKHENKFFDYNYIGEKSRGAVVYMNDVLLQVNHDDRTVKVYDEEPENQFEDMASSNTFLNFSPIKLLRKEFWKYRSDTVIDNRTYYDFVNVEMDTLIGDKQVYLENHLFINPANAFVNLYSRRLFHNNVRSQFIDVEFTDYEFPTNETNLSYLAPATYTSKVAQKMENKILLSPGEMAPDFELVDLEGNKVKLSDFRGKKVFLDFSMIRCGWCKIALDNFSKDDFQFNGDIIPLYINPVDDIDDVVKYARNVNIPFPVFPNGKEVGAKYGVSGYPSFFLIDENGKIEKSFAGYVEDQINELRL